MEPAQPGWADPVTAYHPALGTNSNFCFTLDLGGHDKWGCGLTIGRSRVQGWAGGVLFDR